MMLRYGFGMNDAADDVRRAVTRVLDEGWRTADIRDASTPTSHVAGTQQMGDLVAARLFL